MPLFSALDLADLRRIQDDNLPYRARVEAPTRTDGPGGVGVVAWADVTPATPGARAGVDYTAVPCRLAEVGTGGELLTLNQWRQAARYEVALPAGVRLDAGWRLTITGTDVAGTAFTLVLAVAACSPPHPAEVVSRVVCLPFLNH